MDLSVIGVGEREMELGRRWLLISDLLGAAVGSGLAIAALVLFLG